MARREADRLRKVATRRLDAAKKEAERLSKVATANGVLAPATDLVPEAYRTLKDVMDTSPVPAPRVSAAKAIIDLARAAEAEAREAAGLTGKKAQAQAEAERMVEDDDWGQDISASLSRRAMN